MYSITKTYEDFNGVEKTETFHFNLTKAELMKMEIGTAGGMAEAITKIINAKDAPAIIEIFENLVLKAYGVKSDDGRRFIKSQELRDEFAQTNAYSDIFMELATDDKKAAEFINGVVPAGMAEAAQNAGQPAIAPAALK